MKQLLLVILSFITCVMCYTPEEVGGRYNPFENLHRGGMHRRAIDEEKMNYKYAFYYPLAMGSEKQSKVCLTIDANLLPAKVKISFENETSDDDREHVVQLDYSCWEIKAPKGSKDNNYLTTKIKAEIETKQTNIIIEGEDEVRILYDEVHIFAETDRRVYKPGDLVKIRFLILDFDLKPIVNYHIPLVKIESPYPSRAIVIQRENITTQFGLAHEEFRLAPDTLEGFWSISGDKFYTSFEVKKYVLPRFEAILTGPNNIYNGSESTSYKLCGKYSYGRYVKGKALLSIKINRAYPQNASTINQLAPLHNGCAEFEILTKDLELEKHNVWSVVLTGSIVEDGTEQTESTKKDVYINREPFYVEWDYERSFIKPRLPYTGKLTLTNINVVFKFTRIKLCYKIGQVIKGCSILTTDEMHTIEFTLPPIIAINDKDSVIIEAISLDFPMTYNSTFYLRVWKSKTQNAVEINSAKTNVYKCESTLVFHVMYNSGNLKSGQTIRFKYILSSRGEILIAGAVLHRVIKKELNLTLFPNVIDIDSADININTIRLDQFEFQIRLNKEVHTRSRLLIYYVVKDEVISDFIEFDIEKCTPNKVEAKWLVSPLYPGEIGSLSIKADTGSLCSISSIDKASKFLGTSTEITIENVIGRFIRASYPNKRNCIPQEEKSVDSAKISDIRRPMFYSPLFDSYQAFTESYVGMISNLRFISKPCRGFPIFLRKPGLKDGELAVEFMALPAVAMDAAKTTILSDDRGSAIRSFFPETWLWDLIPVTQHHETVVQRKLPDSITDWVGNVICVSADKGFGISTDIEIKGFKPFFVDILLPFSIKRNKEILHLTVPIFNYLDERLPIRITLESVSGLVLVDGDSKRSFSICLNAQDSYTHKFRIKATKLGNIDVIVKADVDPSHVKNCSSKTIVRRRDVVKKPLLVEPEGYPSGILKSALLCANESLGTNTVKWDIILPKHVILDTVDGKVIINSDILGPMFQNLESILQVPTGCGEQTMATLTPNVYVLKYLEANNALTDKIKEKILKNFEIGYQRMLIYVHDDGSFSAFGKSDKQGSMFLTAFVIRTFRQMKKYIFIDDNVVNKAKKWMTSHQLENGCFDPVHHVLHQMGIASSRNQTTALTAYVIISFLETNTEIDQKVLNSAKDCILADDTSDKYTLAISSYALGLLDVDDEVKVRIDKLMGVSSVKDDMRWWVQSENSLSANVEVTSYVLISILQQDAVGNVGTASSIVKWLQSQMNPRGGFFSTTDTVVGLDALSRYATLINKREPNVTVHVQTKDTSKNFVIIKRDRTRTDIVPLVSYPNHINAHIRGDGCVSIQASINYYLDTPPAVDSLTLNITFKPINEKRKCSILQLQPCVSYTGPGKINMGLIEIAMPSGYAADEASLYDNVSQKVIKKFEQIRNLVVLYLTELGSNEVCIPFNIEANLLVENIATATIKFYDYYRPEVFVSKGFTLEDCDEKN